MRGSYEVGITGRLCCAFFFSRNGEQGSGLTAKESIEMKGKGEEAGLRRLAHSTAQEARSGQQK